MDDKTELLEKIYIDLLSLDFDSLNFHNHIIISKVLDLLRDDKSQESATLPPLPVQSNPQEDLPPIPGATDEGNVLKLKPKKIEQSHHYKILLVDDDPDIHKLIKFSLQTEKSISLISVRSGYEALQKIKILRPDLLIFDTSIKDISSFEFLSKIKEIDKQRDIDILVGSYQSNQHEKNAALELGASDYMARPYDINELKFKLRLKIMRKKLHAANN